MLVVEAYSMRTLYVRRHTMRRKPGQHLSQDGIDLARLVGAESGPFSLVVASPVPRAVETTIAMGFEVDETDESLGRIPSGTASGWPCPFSRISEVVRAGGRAAKFATEIADLWRSIVERVPESAQALIVTHGGIVELGAVAAVPDYPHAAWGDAIGYCEGVRLTFDGRSTGCEVLRVPDEYRLIEN